MFLYMDDMDLPPMSAIDCREQDSTDCLDSVVNLDIISKVIKKCNVRSRVMVLRV